MPNFSSKVYNFSCFSKNIQILSPFSKRYITPAFKLKNFNKCICKLEFHFQQSSSISSWFPTQYNSLVIFQKCIIHLNFVFQTGISLLLLDLRILIGVHFSKCAQSFNCLMQLQAGLLKDTTL